MPRLVRRAPLVERIKAYLNPLDFLLWLSEEIDSNDWDEFQRSYSTPIGLGLNLVFLIARANTGKTTSSSGLDDVFGGEDQGGTGWLSWFVRALFLSYLGCAYLHTQLLMLGFPVIPGLLYRSSPDTLLDVKRHIHFPTKTTLSILPSFGGHHAKHTIGATSPRG